MTQISEEKIMDLSGVWGFALDAGKIGEKENWQRMELSEHTHLPGSTDENGYGEIVDEINTHCLSRLRRYVGPAWYQRSINVPDSWAGKRITLFLERCLWETKVWVNDCEVGSGESLCTPHEFDLTCRLAPGTQRLTIRVDNSAKYNIGLRSHAYSEDMQTIWNGIVGRIELRVQERVCIGALRVYPDLSANIAKVEADIFNSTGKAVNGTLSVRAVLQQEPSSVMQEADIRISALPGTSTHVIELPMGNDVRLWDEFSPNLYKAQAKLDAHLNAENFTDEATAIFGMREFRSNGPVFKLNSRTIFLRGTHEGGCFPLTGYPSPHVADWKRIYRIAKSYGLNHFRFHSYCPPEAAFTAADEEGIILQTELPLFSISAPAIGADALRDDFLRRELDRILSAYGNHPSFCIMCMGNELRGDYRILSEWVAHGKAGDSRHLYVTASNNCAEPSMNNQPVPGDELYVAHASIVNGSWTLRRCENIFKQIPETAGDYHDTLQGIEVPTVSHEIGNWEVYPNYAEIAKYTGVLRARNYEYFRDSLERNGMLDLADKFLQASGRLSVLLYREEIERSLRTPDYGGFQLLDIRDYMGQGTSPIGWLDTFWDSKGLIEPERFRRFCAPVVLLLRMERHVWLNSQTFTAECEIANYGSKALNNLKPVWRIKNSKGLVLATGELQAGNAADGRLSTLGSFSVKLDMITDAEKLSVEISIEEHSLANDWELWVYPANLEIVTPDELFVTDTWNESTEQILLDGKDVLLLARNVNRSEAARFTTPFWNTQLFSGQPKSMGILCDPKHPLFNGFPTEFHSNWQWWELTTDSRALDLSTLPVNIKPIVQSIDHPVRNHRMSLLFEARVGKGRLLCSSLNFAEISPTRPVARQLWSNIMRYIGSEAFNPENEVPVYALREVLKPAPPNWLAAHCRELKADSAWWDGPVERIVDGERATQWKSQRDVPYPHEIRAELTEEVTVWGFRYLPRQDGSEEGMIREYEIYVCLDGVDWGKPVAKGVFEKGVREQFIRLVLIDGGFNTTRSKLGRFIRFLALSGYDNSCLAVVAGLDVLTEEISLPESSC